MTTTPVTIDTNVIVALVDTRDKWHHDALSLRDALLEARAELVYFDCVINEAISVIGRRTEEQKRSDQFEYLLDRLTAMIPEHRITWISASGRRLSQEVIDLCRSHQGRLNFNDALMALACQELGVGFISSFDKDFDEIAWLTRIAIPAEVQHLHQAFL